MRKDINKVGVLKHATDMKDGQVAPVPGGVQLVSIEKESHVELAYMRDTDTGVRRVRVKVFMDSFKKGFFRFTDIDVAGNTREAMARKVGIASAVMAEQLILTYGSKYGIDPSECSKLGYEHFMEMCAVLEKQASQEASV